MTKEQIRTKFDRWAERVGHTPLENDLDNTTLLLSYDDKQTSTTLSTVAVYAVAVHTDHVHVFLFSVQTVWQLDAQNDTGKVLDERYRGYYGVLARVVKKVKGLEHHAYKPFTFAIKQQQLFLSSTDTHKG